jgi:hypothetical protein
MKKHTKPQHAGRTSKVPELIFGVGDVVSYSQEALYALAAGLRISDYLEEHAAGNPGAAAETMEQIMHHVWQCTEDDGVIVSAYAIDEAKYLVFETTMARGITKISINDSPTPKADAETTWF